MDRLVLQVSEYSNEPAIRVHELATHKVVFEIEGAGSVAVSADGSMMAIGVSAGRWEGDKFVPAKSPRCAIVDARTGERVHDIPAKITQGKNVRTAVAFSPDGARLAYAESADETMATIRIFDVATWKQAGSIDVGGDAYSGSPIRVFDLAISRDHLLAAATHGNGLRVWRL
jgi:WD40 repeat protein